MSAKEQLLEQLIADQRRGLRYQMVFSFSLLLFGLLIVMTGLLLPANAEIVKQLVTLGGGFVTSLTALPVRDVLNRREKVSTLRQMITIRHRLGEKDQARLDEIAWKAVEKIVSG